MYFDMHVHILFTSWMDAGKSDPEKTKRQLLGFGIGKAAISAIDALVRDDHRNHQVTNEKILRLCEDNKNFFYPFITVSPEDPEYAVAEIKKYAGKAKGVKLHPWLQGFSLTHPGLAPVFEELSGLNLPVLFHDGTPPYATPFQVGYLAGKFPKVKMILGHSGLKDLWQEAIETAVEHKNIYLCTCSATFFAMLQIVKRIGSDRILFGTDAGFGDINCIWYNLEKVLNLPVSDKAKEKILFKNAFEMIG